ncbi:hypothetical protein ACFRI7_10460 [Streptomyces sp. NPDC056716]|uniref:hypothetical protein n=1 Tax=unclassified Streptomyces TaxID=2593676 RepID=UPI0036867C5C
MNEGRGPAGVRETGREGPRRAASGSPLRHAFPAEPPTVRPAVPPTRPPARPPAVPPTARPAVRTTAQPPTRPGPPHGALPWADRTVVPRRHSPHPTWWLRTALLLLALLVPGTHTGAHALPLTVGVHENGGTAAECDLLDSALRPVTRVSRRPATAARPVPERPAPPGRAAHRPHPAPPAPSYSLHHLRSVVLRC